MMDNNELKRLAEAVEACTSMEVADEAAWMCRTTGEKVLELFDELDHLKAENEAFRSVMAAVVSEIPHGEFIAAGNAPGHCHDIPGIWDQGNGEKSGNECGWCKVWNAARAMSKEPKA